MKTIDERELKELPSELRLAFLPLDKRALGIALGTWFAGAIVAVTAYHLVLDEFLKAHVAVLKDMQGEDRYSGRGLWLLSIYFKGYDPETWLGAAIGGLWGLWTGFVMGWFLAFARNVSIAAWLFLVRTKEQLAANREFLDHI